MFNGRIGEYNFPENKFSLVNAQGILFHIHKDRFDIVTASGILAENHLDCSVFDEMILSLKQGGIAVFATRTEYLTKYGYGDYMKKLADEGKWRYVKENTFSRYD